MNIDDYNQQLDTNGYVVLPSLLTDEECDHYKALLESDCESYANLYKGANSPKVESLANKSGEKVVYNLHNKDLSWFKLFEHPKVLPLLDYMLKEGSYNGEEPYYLNNISARCPLKGHPGQQLHSDSNLPGINYCIIANVLWALDDFTIESGATRVVPGSHKIRSFAPDGEKHKDEIQLTAPKGSAIIFNANLWHGGAENTTEHSRWAIALGYARWFIKPSFDFMQNTPEHIYSQLTDEQKDLLGFRLIPPKDEFTRLRRRSEEFEIPFGSPLTNIYEKTNKN